MFAALNSARDASYIPRITYFDTRGQGKVSRLILEYVEAPYYAPLTRVQLWPGLKSSFALANLPVFQAGDLTLNDADAIYRHPANKHDLYGNNHLERLRCDIVHENFHDAIEALFSLYKDPEFAQKRYYLERTTLPETLFRLESFFETNEHNSGYWSDSRLSYVDLLAWHYLDCLKPLAPSVLARFPRLTEFRSRIEAISTLGHYLESERRPQTLRWPFSGFGGVPETSRD